MSLKAYGHSDTGIRDHNEDAVLIDSAQNLFAVCDGMGGHEAGEVASSMIVQCLRDNPLLKSNFRAKFPYYYEDQALDKYANLLGNALRLANHQVHEYSLEKNLQQNMGSTAAVAFFYEQSLYVAHVGDSRVYFVSPLGLDALTTDHTWVQEQIQNNVLTPEQAEKHAHRNVITRAVGYEATVEVDLSQSPADKGYYLLCTDGLWGSLAGESICEIVLGCDGNLEAACSELIEQAKQNGSADNISALLVLVE